jgi:hypothetical protein
MTGRDSKQISNPLDIRDLSEREEALQAYIDHRNGLEDDYLNSDDIFVQANFFIRNRVTDGFEAWLKFLEIRRSIISDSPLMREQ